jgi:hypothetical protein
MFKSCLPLLATLVVVSGQASAQAVSASYQGGLVSISCDNAPLESVFKKLEEVAGLELILEDAVKNKRLTANLVDVPIAMAVQRLLEGNGVNYAVMMDPRDWGRVDKVFVGAGGGGPARSAAPPRRPPVNRAPDPVDDGYDDFDDTEDMMDDFDDMDDDLVDDPNMENPADFAPPGSSPVPSYLPPQQSFPRSNFTPGLPGPAAPGTNQQQPNQTPPPPATMPFMDALGRPIPVPPDMNQQEQQRRRQQQQQQQQ